MTKTVGLLLTIVGCLILLLGAWYVLEAGRFIAGTEKTTGTVVEHRFTHQLTTDRREVGASGSARQTVDMYAPIIEFETSQGATARFQANFSEGEPPPVGTQVGVRYAAENPGDARVAGLASLFGGAAIVLVLGGIFFGTGVLVFRR